jgi:hypothetical protein
LVGRHLGAVPGSSRERPEVLKVAIKAREDESYPRVLAASHDPSRQGRPAGTRPPGRQERPCPRRDQRRVRGPRVGVYVGLGLGTTRMAPRLQTGQTTTSENGAMPSNTSSCRLTVAYQSASVMCTVTYSLTWTDRIIVGSIV